MKWKGTFLAVIIFAAVQMAGAQSTYISTPANIAIQKPSANKIVTPFSQNAPRQGNKIHRYGKISSRPWAQMSGWRGARTTAYESGEVPDPQLQLISIRF